MDPNKRPIEIVKTFLRLVEERDLDSAARYLAPDVEITFPGGRQFSSLTDQVASSGRRYRSARKEFEFFDVLSDGDDTIVYVAGTLAGEDLAGKPFHGVRFIDRFVLRGGMISDQRVWNDMAEHGLVGRGASSGPKEGQ